MWAWRPLLLLLALPVGAAAGVVDLVGKTMPPYPEGLREVGGICLNDSTDAEHVCDYSIGLLADANDDLEAETVMRYVVAGRMAGRDGAAALWKITDALPYPQVAGDYFWQAGSCRVEKVDDVSVIAVLRRSPDEEYFSDVAWARRLDLKSGKFTVIDPARVDCINEGYGEGP